MKFTLTDYGMLPTTPLGDHIVDTVKERLKEESADMTKQIILGVFDGLGDILVDLIYSISLVGGGILILLKVAGYDDGYKYAGVLFVAHVLIRYLFI